MNITEQNRTFQLRAILKLKQCLVAWLSTEAVRVNAHALDFVIVVPCHARLTLIPKWPGCG